MSIFYSENISSRNTLIASGVNDNSLVLDVAYSNIEKKMTLAEYKKLGYKVINVLQLGADSTGTNDSTAAFQAAIAAIDVDGVADGIIYAPRGLYKISSTLDFGHLRGWKLVGDGGDTIQTSTVTYHSAATRIFWAGANGGTMMKARGAYFVIKDIALYGASIPTAGGESVNRAGIGFLLYFEAGMGSGNALVDNMRITDCDIAWQNGETYDDGNCGDMVFRSMEFRYCGIGMKTVNDQGLNYVFDYLQSTVVDTLFQFDRGGGLYCGMVHTLVTPVLLNIIAPGADTGHYVFDFVKLDADQGATSPQLLVSHSGITSAPVVVFRSLRIPTLAYQSDNIPTFGVAGNTKLIVQDATYLNDEGVILELKTGTAAFYPTALFERCMIDNASSTTPTWWSDTARFVKIIDSANPKTFTVNPSTDICTSAGSYFYTGEMVWVSGTSLPGGLSAQTDYYIANDNVGTPADNFKLVTPVSCTADYTTGTFTASGHGMADSYPVFFSCKSSLPGGLYPNIVYWTANTTTDTFRLGALPGTSGISITTNGTAPHYFINLSGSPCVDITSSGSGTNRAFFASPDCNAADWEFRDCKINGLNLDLPRIGRKKTVYDSSDVVVNMRFKDILNLEYSTSGVIVYMTNNEKSDYIEMYCNSRAQINSGAGSNRFHLSGSAGWAGDADGATFVFRRRNGEWYEVSRTVY